jgi:hypothetical protein
MKYISCLLACLFISTSIWAQKSQYKDRLESLRIAFITEELELTPEESQNFWPVYNAYMDDLSELRKSYKPKGSVELMSDEELEDILSQSIEKDEKEIELKKSFMADMKNILPLRKVVKLKSAEDEFKKRVLQRRRSNMRKQ